MRLILDTNVLVSAMIQRNYPFYVVDNILANRVFQICISDQLFAEYLEVLNRQKFSKFPDFHARAQSLLTDVESRSLKFSLSEIVSLINDDADNRLLELAEACKADYIVTGNTNDFTMTDFKGTKIISPKGFFEVLNL